VTTKPSQVRLKPLRAVVGIPLEMFERSKCFVGKGFEELLKGQYAGFETGSLIGRAMLVDPVPHHLLLRSVNRFRLCAPLGAACVTDADVCLESAKSLGWDLFQNPGIATSIEMHRASVGHHLTPSPSRRGMNDRATRRVAEKVERDLVAPVVEPLALHGLARRPLRMVGALELMIACCVLQEIFDGRRMIVDRRELDLHDALIGVQLELRTQLQAGDAVAVDVHQMKASDGHCNLQSLFRSPVASSQKRRLTPRF